MTGMKLVPSRLMQVFGLNVTVGCPALSPEVAMELDADARDRERFDAWARDIEPVIDRAVRRRVAEDQANATHQSTLADSAAAGIAQGDPATKRFN